jgi:arylsulfatase
MDARDAEKPETFEIKAPEGAPNVVVVLIDDIGFGATSTFGGPIQTPTFDRLADNGLRFNRFHTTALCSPTRAALLSGRNLRRCP